VQILKSEWEYGGDRFFKQQGNDPVVENYAGCFLLGKHMESGEYQYLVRFNAACLEKSRD